MYIYAHNQSTKTERSSQPVKQTLICTYIYDYTCVYAHNRGLTADDTDGRGLQQQRGEAKEEEKRKKKEEEKT